MQEILQTFLRTEGLETPLLEYRIIQAWPEVAGQAVSRYTSEVTIRNGVLQVRLTSPALKQNLMMGHRQLAQRLNEHVGANVISDINFI